MMERATGGPPLGQGPSGYQTAETFPLVLDFRSFFVRLIPILIALVIVTYLLVYFSLLMFGIGTAAAIIPVPIALALGGLLYWAKRRQFAASTATAELTLSPAGLVMADRWTRTELPWSNIASVGPVQMMNPAKASFNDAAAVTGELAAAVLHSAVDGVLGDGTFVLAPDAPRLLRTQVQQNQPGGSRTGIGLALFDPQWRAGRVGEWIRAYRPDLSV